VPQGNEIATAGATTGKIEAIENNTIGTEVGDEELAFVLRRSVPVQVNDARTAVHKVSICRKIEGTADSLGTAILDIDGMADIWVVITALEKQGERHWVVGLAGRANNSVDCLLDLPCHQTLSIPSWTLRSYGSSDLKSNSKFCSYYRAFL
jgi:hypothetical protein